MFDYFLMFLVFLILVDENHPAVKIAVIVGCLVAFYLWGAPTQVQHPTVWRM